MLVTAPQPQGDTLVARRAERGATRLCLVLTPPGEPQTKPEPPIPVDLGPLGFHRAVKCSSSPGARASSPDPRVAPPVWEERACLLQCLHSPAALGQVAQPRGEQWGWATGISPLGLPGNYALGANINKGSTKGVLFLDLTTRLLHMREISGPHTVSIPRPSSPSNLLPLLILTGFSQAGNGVAWRGSRYRERWAICSRLWEGWKNTQGLSLLPVSLIPPTSTSLDLQPTALPSPSFTLLPPGKSLPLSFSSPCSCLASSSFLNPSSSKNHSLEPHLMGGSNSLSYLE